MDTNITSAEYDTYEIDMQHREARVEELMREIEEKIDEFVSLTGERGAKHIKPRWRDIKKSRRVK